MLFRSGILIVMLGANDLLNGASAGEAAKRMEAFLEQYGAGEIVLTAPPPMKRGAWVTDDRLVSESKELSIRYRELADRMGIKFADAGKWDIELAYDGVHFSEKGHARFADAIASILMGYLYRDDKSGLKSEERE